MTLAPSTSWQMNPRLGGSPISVSHAFETPSPQRTGVPISARFSIIRTSAPARAAYFAAALPVGPAPTIRTSTSRSSARPSDSTGLHEPLGTEGCVGRRTVLPHPVPVAGVGSRTTRGYRVVFQEEDWRGGGGSEEGG